MHIRKTHVCICMYVCMYVYIFVVLTYLLSLSIQSKNCAASYLVTYFPFINTRHPEWFYCFFLITLFIKTTTGTSLLHWYFKLPSMKATDEAAIQQSHVMTSILLLLTLIVANIK